MKPRKVIIDCDPGIDDFLAIVLALSIPEIEVIGITIVCGNVPVNVGVKNALKALKFMEREDIPIYIGEKQPLKRAYIDATDTHGVDGLGQSNLKESKIKENYKDAISFYEEILLENEDISVIALGPLTNLAKLYIKNKKAFCKIKELITMGGSYLSHGNCSPVAEYNYWCDPESAKIVYEAYENELENKYIHMVGLDVTRKIVLTPNLVEYMKRINKNKGEIIEKITNFYMDYHYEHEGIIGCVINDPLAVAYFYNKNLCEGFYAYTTIETQGISFGQTIVDKYDIWKKQKNSYILTKTNYFDFMKLFITKVFDEKEEKVEEMLNQILVK